MGFKGGLAKAALTKGRASVGKKIQQSWIFYDLKAPRSAPKRQWNLRLYLYFLSYFVPLQLYKN